MLLSTMLGSGVRLSAASHLVGVLSDELGAGEAFARALASEGLPTHLQRIDERLPAVADALVLHVSGCLAEQLGRLRALRAQAPATPLMLAVRELRDLDQVLGLELGADDAVDSALSAPVTAARLRALWRRAGPRAEPEPPRELRFGSLELRQLERQARLEGRVLPLTEGEFEVLWILASRAGQTVPRRELLRSVRGLDDHPMDRSIDNRVYRIRAKLGEGAAQRLRTVRNRGYLFSPSGW